MEARLRRTSRQDSDTDFKNFFLNTDHPQTTSLRPRLFHCKGSILLRCRLHTCLVPTVRYPSAAVDLESLISVHPAAILAIGGTDRNIQIWVCSEGLVCRVVVYEFIAERVSA